MISGFEMLGASFFLVLTLMCTAWIIYYFKRNASIVDIAWALAFVLTSWAYFFLGEGNILKKWSIFLMVNCWGLRLAWQLYQRFMISAEDPRYQEIRKNWGKENTDFKFFMMFIFQGVLVVVLSLPFLIICNFATSIWQGVEICGIVIWALGVMGEALADKQLYDFKLQPENEKKVCQKGLWYYSRHPNYFFEFIVWIGYSLFAIGTPGGWLGLVSAGLMLLLLTKVSGIPLAEAESIKTKGVEYEEYQRTTNAFIPWFPKK
jgi:steroid 5-alpha reductase family enzyme